MLIGITGRAGSGKDTVADHLMRVHNFGKYSMAQPLKEMLKVIGVPCDTQEEKAATNPVFGVTNRYLAQTLGTEWMRNCIAEDGWIRLAEKEIREWCGSLVIPDIRYNNEAEMIIDHGGLILQINRPYQENIAGSHVSESGIIPEYVSYIVNNDGTIPQLLAMIDAIILTGTPL